MSTTIATSVEGGILTIDQAAAYLSIPKATLYTWRTRRAGSVPGRSSSVAVSATVAPTLTRGSRSTSRASTTWPSRSSGPAPESRCPVPAGRAEAGLATWDADVHRLRWALGARSERRGVRDGAYRAHTRIRDKDGVTREVTATGTTTAAAERALREKLVDRATPTQQAITADIIDLMLATGARIGEILAVRWTDVELDATRPSLTINGTIKTEPGKGTYRKPSPKSDASVRTVVLPDFAVAVLRRRHGATRENPQDAVFPTRNGTWQQVNNVERRWRQIRQDTGLDWVTPHTFRKTVATLISERVDAETASQQLGHSSPTITREFYISKPAIAADVSHVLEELARPEDA